MGRAPDREGEVKTVVGRVRAGEGLQTSPEDQSKCKREKGKKERK